MLRRAFLKLLGLGALGAAAPAPVDRSRAWPDCVLDRIPLSDEVCAGVYRYANGAYIAGGGWTCATRPVYGPGGAVLYVEHTLRPRREA
jgi:hypothetical protein